MERVATYLMIARWIGIGELGPAGSGASVPRLGARTVLTKMASAETARSGRRFAAAVGLASLLHAGLLFVDRSDSVDAVRGARGLLEVDVALGPELISESLNDPSPTSSRGISPGPSAIRISRAESAARSPLPRGEAAIESGEATSATNANPTVVDATNALEGASNGPKKPGGVRLFLNARDLKEIASDSFQETTPETQPSVGLLREGLAAMDAEKGLSPSSPQVSAGYRAAAAGPAEGTAMFEVRTDSRGVVTSVQVLGGSGDGAWGAVASELLRRLKQQRMRVPEGCRGIVTRLRIDRGSLAEALSERGRTKRGVALGQDRHAKDYAWDESTQASSRPDRLIPTLGLSSESLTKTIKTKVTLLSQVVL